MKNVEKKIAISECSWFGGHGRGGGETGICCRSSVHQTSSISLMSGCDSCVVALLKAIRIHCFSFHEECLPFLQRFLSVCRCVSWFGNALKFRHGYKTYVTSSLHKLKSALVCALSCEIEFGALSVKTRPVLGPFDALDKKVYFLVVQFSLRSR